MDEIKMFSLIKIMSVTNNKAALFATSKDENPPPLPTQLNTTKASVTAGSTASYSRSSSTTSGMSSTIKNQKLADAKANIEKAQAFLKTSLFQWKPDYLAAAPMYEKASECYKQAGDYYKAVQMLLRCVDCHENCGASSSAAVAWTKAAQISRSYLKDARQSAQFLKSAGDCWGNSGDLTKYGETYAKAAKELEEVDGVQALELYLQGLNYLYPEDTPLKHVAQLPPALPEILRNLFSLYLRLDRINEAIKFGSTRMVPYFDQVEMENTSHKTLAAITILQLSIGSITKAQNDYTQEHMNCRGYLRSKECELVDNLLRAYSTGDEELLNNCKRSTEMNFLDQHIARIGRKLELPLVSDEESEMPEHQERAPRSRPEEAFAELDNLRISETSNDSSLPVPPAPPSEEDAAATVPPSAEEDEDEIDLS